ncbi:hypothetical protein LQZ19_08465 [Treponema primitia]|uniref:hypothetical protein n=1 Tax=Treponema primitia TaxID=88058 RepID=UPI00397F21D2
MVNKKKDKTLMFLVGITVALSTISCVAKEGGANPAQTTEVSQETPSPKPRPEDDPAYTGVWRVRQYVDEFGDKTDDKYIGLREKISGKFSNILTKDGDLGVSFLIDDDSVGIEFYLNYFGESDDPEDLILFDPATITVRDKDGTDHKFRGRVPNMTGTRLYVSPYEDLIDILKSGGKIRFSVRTEVVLLTSLILITPITLTGPTPSYDPTP